MKIISNLIPYLLFICIFWNDSYMINGTCKRSSEERKTHLEWHRVKESRPVKANLIGRCDLNKASMHVSHEGTSLAINRLLSILKNISYSSKSFDDNFRTLTNLNIWPRRKRLPKLDPRIIIEPVERPSSLLQLTWRRTTYYISGLVR